MRMFFTVLLSVFLMFVAQVAAFAQDSDKTDCSLPKTTNNPPDDYKDWQKVELSSFKFYIPNNLKSKSVKCYEGNCYHFESEDLKLTVDVNTDAWRPTFERSYASYLSKFVQIGGRSAWIWHFEDEGIYKYISGVNFKFKEDKNYGMGIYLSSKTKNVSEVAEKIFNSVTFNNEVK